jgi:hypothetical protein
MYRQIGGGLTIQATSHEGTGTLHPGLVSIGESSQEHAVAIGMKISTSHNPIATGLVQLVDGVIATFGIGASLGHPLWAMAFMAASVWCVMFGARNLGS